jgi:hypothetical protein
MSKIAKHFSQHSQHSGQDLKKALPTYQPQQLSLQPTCSVFAIIKVQCVNTGTYLNVLTANLCGSFECLHRAAMPYVHLEKLYGQFVAGTEISPDHAAESAQI